MTENSSRRALAVLSVVLCLAAIALYWQACEDGAKVRKITTSSQQATSTNQTATWECKTLQVEFSADRDQARREQNELMQELHQSGWLILSGSKPIALPDGTTRRTYQLKRPKY